MNLAEQKSLLSIALLAAFADDTKADQERDEIRRVAESLPDAAALNLPQLYQEVLFKRVTLASVAKQLESPQARLLAFEIAVGVCDADKLRSDAETRFLDELGGALGLSTSQMAQPTTTADALATIPLARGEVASPPASVTANRATSPVAAGRSPVNEAELDASILNYSILNGALEILPGSMASMAIIPLQMKMVYRVGKAYGFELDRGHIKDLLATMGVGLTGQYLEDIGRKLIGGLLGKVAGRAIGGLGRSATGAAFSFATTYALGHVAKRYYGGGRAMTAQMLKDAFADVLGQAKSLQAQYLPQIEQKARTVDVNQIVQMVRSQ